MNPRDPARLPSFVRFALAAVLVGTVACGSDTAVTASPVGGEPDFDSAFWDHWGDGQAELCGYDLVFPRYGEERSGTAVTIFVTETFSHEARVKADPGVHSADDEYPVMKLNLVQDFPTGVYDYQLMTSAFYAITSRDGRPVGSPAKITFSAQEWCGHAFHELLPDAKKIRSISHSYFDGEGDQSGTLDYPRDALFEDGLFHWARGMAFPRLEPGETRTVPILRSTELARLRHVPVVWETAEIRRGEGATSVEVPAGTFAVETLTVEIRGDRARTWTFRVETAEPRRVIRWEASDGRQASLIASDRLPYWRMNGPGFEKELARIGLSPRPARTP